jgi:hypothetical protein
MEPYNELVCSCGCVVKWTAGLRKASVKFVTDEQGCLILTRPIESPVPCACTTIVSRHVLRYEVDAADVVTLTVEKCPKQTK